MGMALGGNEDLWEAALSMGIYEAGDRISAAITAAYVNPCMLLRVVR